MLIQVGNNGKFRLEVQDGVLVNFESDKNGTLVITVKPAVETEEKVQVKRAKNDEEIEQKIVQEYQHKGLLALAKEYKKGPSTIKNILLKNGVELRAHGQRIGCDAPARKTTSIEFSLEEFNKHQLLRLQELLTAKVTSKKRLMEETDLPEHFVRIVLMDKAGFTEAFINHFYALGTSLQGLATILKKSVPYVRSRIPDEDVRKRGDRSQSLLPGEHLKPEERRAIYQEHLYGKKPEELAVEYQVSLQTVHKCIKGN